MTTFRKLPKEVSCLTRDWFPKGTDPLVESNIRFGSRVVNFGVVHRLFFFRSGRAGTIQFFDIDKTPALEIERISKMEYVPPGACKEKSEQAMLFLREFLETKGVELTVSYHNSFPFISDASNFLHHEIFYLAADIINLLPNSHLGHSHFIELKLGGWSGSFALCSEYNDPTVHIYNFALEGPRRNFIALLLHEIGHSIERIMEPSDLEKLEELRKKIQVGLGLDYLDGRSARIARMLSGLKEFVAETYLVYVVAGRHMDNIGRIRPDQGDLWKEIKTIFKKYFEGIEYIK
ncbi:hypothetical protein KKB44_04710 [Candidatus Micrarchaeota archaeon]|nr:hypothetical protein [Candidatus Micrarchaeota archaeon]